MEFGASYDRLVGRIFWVKQRWRAISVIEGIFRFLTVLLGGLVIFAIAEAVFHFPSFVRLIMLILWLGASAATVAYFVFGSILHDWTEEEVALHIEKTFPDIHNGLINSVLLGKEKRVPSPAMVARAMAEIDGQVSECRLTDAIDRRPLVRYTLFTLLLLTICITGFILFQARFANALERLVRPTDEVPAVGNVIVEEIIPGDCTIVSGDDLTIKAIIKNPKGRVVSASLYFRAKKGEEIAQAMTGVNEVTFATDLPEVKVPLTYRVVIGTTQSKRYRVLVAEKPIVTGIEVQYEYPEYTGLKPHKDPESDGNLKAIRGTHVSMKITMNKAMSTGALLIDGKDRVPLRVSADSVALSMPKAMTIERDMTYTINVKDADGYGNRNPLVRYIRALPDEKPAVKVVQPGRDVIIPLGGKVQLAIKASDDFGVKEVVLLAKKGLTGKEKPIHRWTEFVDPKLAAIGWEWTLDPKEYKLQDTVVYCVQVTDNSEIGEPGVVRSANYRIDVRDKDAEKKQRVDKLSGWRKKVEALLQTQKEARQETDRVLRMKGEGR